MKNRTYECGLEAALDVVGGNLKSDGFYANARSGAYAKLGMFTRR